MDEHDSFRAVGCLVVGGFWLFLNPALNFRILMDILLYLGKP